MAETVCIFYVTTGSEEEARQIAEVAVSERLAACANILGEIGSVYRWEGEVRQDREWSMILKTSSANVKDLTARIYEIHSYDCPCVVSLPVDSGNTAFLDWIQKEVK